MFIFSLTKPQHTSKRITLTENTKFSHNKCLLTKTRINNVTYEAETINYYFCCIILCWNLVGWRALLGARAAILPRNFHHFVTQFIIGPTRSGPCFSCLWANLYIYKIFFSLCINWLYCKTGSMENTSLGAIYSLEGLFRKNIPLPHSLESRRHHDLEFCQQIGLTNHQIATGQRWSRAQLCAGTYRQKQK